jgi:predicted DNA-binding transcriptional regulator AlpA
MADRSDPPVSSSGPILRDGDSRLLSDFARKEQLAQEFGVSERTIERWVRMRILPKPVRLGRTLLFHIPTIRRYLESQSSGDRPRQSRRT